MQEENVALGCDALTQQRIELNDFAIVFFGNEQRGSYFVLEQYFEDLCEKFIVVIV